MLDSRDRRDRRRVQPLPRRLRALAGQRARALRGSRCRRCSSRRSTSRCAAPGSPTASSTRRSARRCACSATTATSSWSTRDGPPLARLGAARAGLADDRDRPESVGRSRSSRRRARLRRDREGAVCRPRRAPRSRATTGASVLVGLGGDVAIGGPRAPNGWALFIADDHAAAARRGRRTHRHSRRAGWRPREPRSDVGRAATGCSIT